jgi:hypothetical protein
MLLLSLRKKNCREPNDKKKKKEIARWKLNHTDKKKENLLCDISYFHDGEWHGDLWNVDNE